MFGIKSVSKVLATIADLITRTKGLDDIHDDLVTHAADLGSKGAGDDLLTRAGAFTAAQNLKAILGDLTATKNLGGILGAYTTAANLKAAIDAIQTIVGALPDSGALTALLADIDPKAMGRLQMASASWDGRVGDTAGSDVLLTATDQAVVVESVIVVMAATPDLTNDPWTGISVEDDYATTPHTFIPAANGVKANQTANAQLAWTGAVYLAVGKSIQATAIGDDADEDASITVIVLYRAVVSGGSLA